MREARAEEMKPTEMADGRGTSASYRLQSVPRKTVQLRYDVLALGMVERMAGRSVDRVLNPSRGVRGNQDETLTNI